MTTLSLDQLRARGRQLEWQLRDVQHRLEVNAKQVAEVEASGGVAKPESAVTLEARVDALERLVDQHGLSLDSLDHVVRRLEGWATNFAATGDDQYADAV